MKTTTYTDSAQLRAKAFQEFREAAQQEKRDFAYNIAYRRLVPQFSTAPTDTTAKDLRLIEDAARLGHAELVEEVGTELFNWSHANGYHPA